MLPNGTKRAKVPKVKYQVVKISLGGSGEKVQGQERGHRSNVLVIEVLGSPPLVSVLTIKTTLTYRQFWGKAEKQSLR